VVPLGGKFRSGGLRMLNSVLCTSGLAAEARIARAAGFQVVVGAGDPERTTALVEAASRHAHCLISFGIAGALAPHLRSGDVILSAEVIGPDRRWRAEGPVLGAGQPLATEDDKARAWRNTGALAVDMESAIVARAAEAAGIPFLVLRTIADPATRALPRAALIPLSPDGTPALTRVLGEVLRRPRQIAALFGLARETRQALLALAGPAHSLRANFAA
jgi:nucleoside phosphorylase